MSARTVVCLSAFVLTGCVLPAAPVGAPPAPPQPPIAAPEPRLEPPPAPSAGPRRPSEPVTEQPAPALPNPEPMPAAPVEAPAPVRPTPRPHPRESAPALEPKPKPEVTPAPPPPVLERQLSESEQRTLREDAARDVQAARTLALGIKREWVAGDREDVLRMIASLLDQAEKALAKQMYIEAKILAGKVITLSRDLPQANP